MFNFNFPILIIRSLKLVLAFIGAIAFEIFNLRFLQPYLQQPNSENETNMIFETLLNNFSWIIFIGFIIIVAGMLWKWKTDDEYLKRKNLITILARLQELQMFISMHRDSTDPKEFSDAVDEASDLIIKLKRHRNNDVIKKIRAEKELENEPY